MEEELDLFSSITELATLIRTRKLSSVKLTEAYLERLQKYGPHLNAVANVLTDSALTEAVAADREIQRGRYRGPLHGIPYGVKDLVATRIGKTTWGAKPYENQQFNFDGTVVEKLRDAGAVLVAKLAMVELAGGMGYNEASASLTGPCKTPWNTDFWSGGSSSGPGAATAGGLVAFSIGSETSGSIITPAAFSGVSGFRPTYGAVSRHGAMALCWTLDKLGPMCRSAADCGIVMRAIAGKDPHDPTSKNFPGADFPDEVRRRGRDIGRDVQRLFGRTPAAGIRIGVMKDSYDKAQPEVKENFLRSVEVLRKFGKVEMDVKLPDFPYGPTVGTIVDAEGAAAFRDLIESGGSQQLASPNGRVGGYSASLVTAVDYLHAVRLRIPMRKAWNEMFKKIDVLVAPSRSTVAYPIDKTFDQAYPSITAASPIGASNLVGVPAISIQNGFGQHNLPTGIQFVGPAWSDYSLIELAVKFQQATDWHKRRPAM
jgi:aspartyl-tRNA(Asn)/glutamyl-tRNA(Gln) amidotransferase subunit A